ncbi:hypothetical protein BDA99DRAFT_516906 [Phascolomyces articulosus]|uniref:DUF221-domain-containing protein n=1 Tax=Phascolomyces articulosus TaxID=60185 RepID=A0AAD5JVP6_9FUNG|nr:hypothetical protein BDA99DRAFT_516906 [Phascolomyces articulosus]
MSSMEEQHNATSHGFPFLDIGNGGFENVPGTSSYSARNQSGLTTQLMVCAGTGLICFLTFCILRTRWTVIFAPRMNMKKHKPKALPNSLFGWVIPLIKINEQEIMDTVGLDAVVMLQFIVMAIKLFGICSFFGIATLVPISVTTGNVTNTAANMTSGQLDQLAITVLQDESPYLIAYLFFTYFFCFLTFFFLNQNFRSFVANRSEYLLRMSRSLSSRTVVVTGIPHPLRSDAKLEEYYNQLGIGTVESAQVVRHIRHLRGLLKKRAYALQKLEEAYVQYWGNPCKIPDYDPDRILDDAHLFQRVDQEATAMMKKEDNKDNDGKNKQEDENSNDTTTGAGAKHNTTFLLGNQFHGKKSRRPQIRVGFLGLFGKKVDAIDYYTEEFEHLDTLVSEARSNTDNYEMTNVGFITFKDMASALIASQIAINPEPFNCRTAMAYEPRDVLWKNITVRGRERLIREFMVWTITLLLSFFWIVPISAFSTMTSLETLEHVFPNLASAAQDSVFLQNLLQGLVPTIAVNIFMAILPLIFDALGVVQGLRSRSAIADSTFTKYFFFLLFNVLLVFTIASTITKTVEQLINHPAEIANVLGTTLPAVAPFFINYILLQGMLLMPLSLLMFGSLIIRGYTHLFCCKTPRDYATNRAPWSFNYGTGYPPPLLIFIIVLEYSTISPIILLFGTVYFCITYIVYKYQFLYVYFRPYDAIGSAWTMVFPRVIVGMLLFQITMAGLFLLKKYITLAVLCVPLMVITLLFKVTMDAAFHKNSQNLPMATLREHTQMLPTIIKTPPMNEKQYGNHHHDDDDDDRSSITSDSSSSSSISDEDITASTEQVERLHPQHLQQQQQQQQQNNHDPIVDSCSSSNDNMSREQAKSRWRLATAFAISTSSSKLSVQRQQQQSVKHRRRRVVLDEDDYQAIPDHYTDYRQPPMMLNPGVLDTGLKRYGNPALIGVLPQLWLPIKDGEQHKPLAPSKRLSSNHFSSSSFNKIPGHSANDLARLLRRAESARNKRVGILDHHHCTGKDGKNTVTVLSSSSSGSSCNNSSQHLREQLLENQQHHQQKRRSTGFLRRFVLSRSSGAGDSMGSIKEASVSQEHILQDMDEDPRIREELHLAPLHRSYDETSSSSLRNDNNNNNNDNSINMHRMSDKQHLFPPQYY